MEKLTLKPHSNEIVVNNGAADGAVDLFCYAPDEVSLRNLGALYVIGHRETDSSNMGYMVSLIAALARREYYAQASTPPREAFARTLRKANEVVEEFFRTGDVKLSVGIVAVAGGQVMVSKLDKFKILLARDDQVIDILSNVLLFSKEHTEKRRFSSIIHGSIQAGDRILAFVPTRSVTTRERNLKGWFLKLPQSEFAERVEHLGAEHASFATAMLHIDIAQTSEPALMPSPQPPELMPQAPSPSEPGLIAPSLASAAVQQSAAPAPLVWAPRQQSPNPATVAPTPSRSPVPIEMPPAEIEAPHLISTEFSLGIRRTSLSRLLSRFHIVRLDTRGKAIALALVAIIVTTGVLAAKSFFFVSPAQQQFRTALQALESDVRHAKDLLAQSQPVEARQILTRALSSLNDLSTTDSAAKELSAAISTALDGVDNAESVQPTLLASPGPDAAPITLATWASPSQTVWVGSVTDGALSIAALRDGSTTGRMSFGAAKAQMLVGWHTSALAIDMQNRTILRSVGDAVKPYVIPMQETVLDAAEFADSLYVLTDKSILKITDLDTEKPVTKRWLTGDTELADGAARIFVDGSVYTMGRDGTLTTYYKGARTNQVASPLSLSGTWRLLPGADGLFAVAVGDARRVYLVDPATGGLVRTLKVDSQIPYTYVAPGPDGSVLMLTAEGKLWKVQ